MPEESAAFGLYPTASSLGTAETLLCLPEGEASGDSVGFGLSPPTSSLDAAELFFQNTVLPIHDPFALEMTE